MAGVRSWLEGIGLAEYVNAFEANDIDLEILRDLTDADLKQLGVTSTGHRVRLRTAIGDKPRDRRDAAPNGPTDDAAPQRTEPPTENSPQAERRQITVMFCDLVDSATLAEQLDPEDLRTLMQGYQRACSDVVEQYEGHVAQYLGDGLMTYFGWPRAHEDDAERSVHAALDIIEAVKTVDAPDPLSVRIGISTGRVVVGDTGAGDASSPKLAVGETPNRAARLQALAEPDTIVLGPLTHHLTKGAFEYSDLGEHRLKGILEPVRARRVTGPSSVIGRFEARHGGDLPPPVGRDSEIAMLIDRWEQAKDGEGQVVLLSGEPGIGKSRILRALRDHVDREPHQRLRYQCSPYHTNSAFYPVIEQLVRVARFAVGDSDERKLEKLEHIVSVGTERPEDAMPYFAELLRLPVSDRYPLPPTNAEQRKDRSLEFMAEQVVTMSRHNPLLLIVEDMHWIDPSSLESVSRDIDRIGHERVLMVLTHRPHFTSPWSGRSHVTTLTLNRLSRDQAAEVATRIAGNKLLPATVVDEIVAKADGVPLFVEELTKDMLESGKLVETESGYQIGGHPGPLSIPATIQDSLMARLDRLASIKDVAQVGAVIGRTFGYELLSAISDKSDADLQSALRQFMDSELIFGHGTPPNATYTFKHVLVQETAYASLLKGRRQELHALIADVIAERFPQLAETEPELIAHHCTHAGALSRAVGYWTKAGKLASARTNNLEAIAHLRKGLEVLAEIPKSVQRDRLELELQVTLGSPLLALRGYTSEEAGNAYANARILSDRLGDNANQFPVLFGVWVYHWNGGDLREARTVAEDFLERADRDRSHDAVLMGQRNMGLSMTGLGRLEDARKHLQKSLELYDPATDRGLSYLYTQDPWVAASGFLSLTLWALGHRREAAETSAKSVTYARDIDHPFSLGYALFCAALFHAVARDPEAVGHCAAEGRALCRTHSFPVFLAYARFFEGYAQAASGAPEAGIDEMVKGLEETKKLGMVVWRPVALAVLAEVYAEVGEHRKALDAVERGLRRAASREEHFALADLYRLKGILLSRKPRGNTADAESWLQRALDTARVQGARSWELRAAIALAELWQDQGKSTQAATLIEPLVNDGDAEAGDADFERARAIISSQK